MTQTSTPTSTSIDKSLAGKAIQIQGKDYVLVSDRIIYFNEQYPMGSIKTELITDPLSDIVIMKATVYPCDEQNPITFQDKKVIPKQREFTGYSQAVKGAGFINKTAALENAETSAVGRALAMMGIGVIDSVASADEINKSKGTDSTVAEAKQRLFKTFKEAGITESIDMMANIQQATGKDTVESVADANKVIKHLKGA